MRYIFVVIVALCLFLPARADSLVVVSLETRGVNGPVCFSGSITTPAAGGYVEEFCTGTDSVASINLPAWVPYRLTERVPPGYAVSKIECSGAGKYRASGASVTVNVEGGPVSCVFPHIRKSGRMPRVTP